VLVLISQLWFVVPIYCLLCFILFFSLVNKFDHMLSFKLAFELRCWDSELTPDWLFHVVHPWKTKHCFSVDVCILAGGYIRSMEWRCVEKKGRCVRTVFRTSAWQSVWSPTRDPSLSDIGCYRPRLTHKTFRLRRVLGSRLWLSSPPARVSTGNDLDPDSRDIF